MHAWRDVEHAEEVRTVLSPRALASSALQAAESALAANWELLSGVVHAARIVQPQQQS